MASVALTNKKRGLAAIVGAGAAASLLTIVPQFEGTKQKTYRDPIGVLTYCTGATENAIWGKTYTLEECRAQLDKDLAMHAEGVMACVHRPMTEGQRIAFVDIAYNIGTAGFCKSSMARHANAGDVQGSCDALLMYSYAGGQQWPGLVKRREAERKICVEDKND
jgi:lysozyme